MQNIMYEFCLQRLSNASARDSGILADIALLGFLVRFALFFQPQRALRQPLPSGTLEFPPQRLRRFLRGFVVATAYGLVTAPASVLVYNRKKIFLRNRIFARVMSGFVMREEVRLKAAAAARIVDKSGIVAAAESGDVADVLSYLISDANCVNEED